VSKSKVRKKVTITLRNIQQYLSCFERKRKSNKSVVSILKTLERKKWSLAVASIKSRGVREKLTP